MENIFKTTYNEVKKAQKAFSEAISQAEKDEAEKAYDKAIEEITAKGKIATRIWNEYEEAMDCGNEYLDVNYVIWDNEVKALIDTLRENGIEHFTFSATWSSAIETAWLFEKNGCKMQGLVEINGRHKKIMSDEYEKVHALLFRL